MSRYAWALLACVACGPAYGDGYLAAMASADRALSAGRYEEANTQFGQAASRATRIKDRDEARFMQARTLEKVGKYSDARAMYDRLMNDSPTGPRTGRAAYERCDLDIEHGDKDRGYDCLFDTLRRYPNHGHARQALLDLVEHERTRGGDAGVLAWLERVTPVFASTELAQRVDYERGRALIKLDRKVEARDLFVATARAHPYPTGSLTDDALALAAELDLELGRTDAAIADLREMLAPLEISDEPGSYERPRFPYAQMRIAVIYRDVIRDTRAARREFLRLVSDHPASTFRDDALWEASRLARADGDTAEACTLASKIARELSESRYAPCAADACGRATEGNIAPGRACPSYAFEPLKVPVERPGARPVFKASSDD